MQPPLVVFPDLRVVDFCRSVDTWAGACRSLSDVGGAVVVLQAATVSGEVQSAVGATDGGTPGAFQDP